MHKYWKTLCCLVLALIAFSFNAVAGGFQTLPGIYDLDRNDPEYFALHGECYELTSKYGGDQVVLTGTTKPEWDSFISYAKSNSNIDVADCPVQYSGWSGGSCSASCGGGTLTETRSCIFEPSGATIPCEYCGGQCSRSSSCNEGACAGWQRSCPANPSLNTSNNPATCGKSCTVTCEADGQVVSNSECTGTPPSDYIAYPRSACGYRSCALPWGGSIPHEGRVTAYQSASVPYGNLCTGETRVCDDGVLSGSYTNQTCTVGTQPQVCTPNEIENENSSRACPSGYTGTETGTRSRSCNGTGTAWGSWSSWSWDDSSCASQTCTPGETQTKDESRECSSGYGTETRTGTRSCNGSGTGWSNWSYTGWDTSGCTALTCTPNQTETQATTGACPSGYVGTRTGTRSRVCSSNGMSWSGWSAWSWNNSTCTPQVCTPNQVQSETETAACPTGYTGNKTRTKSRTCNSNGTAWGGWNYSAWNESSCQKKELVCRGVGTQEVTLEDVMISEYGERCGKRTERWTYDLRQSGSKYDLYETSYYYKRTWCSNLGYPDEEDSRSYSRKIGSYTANKVTTSSGYHQYGGGYGGWGCEECGEVETRIYTFEQCE